MKLICLSLVLLTLVCSPWRAKAAEGPSPEQVEFFEKQVRPLLVQNCNECHGAKKQEAGLRLDTQAGLLKGSDGGIIFHAGNVDGSRLFQVLKYAEGEIQMPPKGKLSDEQLTVMRKWIEQNQDKLEKLVITAINKNATGFAKNLVDALAEKKAGDLQIKIDMQASLKPEPQY